AWNTLEDVRNAPNAEFNIVASYSGLTAVRWLEARFGTPWQIADVAFEPNGEVTAPTLIVGDQIIANGVRSKLDVSASVASFFGVDAELSRDGDIHLKSERHLIELLKSGEYKSLIADPIVCAIPAALNLQKYKLPHPAISSYLYWDKVKKRVSLSTFNAETSSTN
ncbi:MAG: nitrogenase component 1, partial [Oscillospiraceae bacterium]|nr:nitrogenase component 1 [Oscillospiraceae bacterium]